MPAEPSRVGSRKQLDLCSLSPRLGEPHDQSDVLPKVLRNALRYFCDTIELDETKNDAEAGVVGREVQWRYRRYIFRARLVTFDGSQSIGIFEYRGPANAEWCWLSTPYALAEKITEAGETSA